MSYRSSGRTLRRSGAGLAMGLALLASACTSSGGGGRAATGGAAEASAYPSGGDSAFNAKWSALIAKAKKEGTLTILDGPNVANGEGPVFAAFAKEYGLKLTQVTGSSDEIVSRVLAERQQGIHSVDVAMPGDGATKRLLDAKVFTPLTPLLISPEALDRSAGWPEKSIPWSSADAARKYVTAYSERVDANFAEIWYNTAKVKASDVKSWADLLEPKYKGKIVLGDVSNGETSGYRILSWIGLGSKFFDPLVRKQDPTVLPVGDAREMSDGLSRGEWYFAIFIDSDDPFLSAQKDGLPVSVFPNTMSEGTAISPDSNLGVFDHPAHPAVAQLFANWMLSKQGQATYNALNKNSEFVALRTDVPQGGIAAAIWARAKSRTNLFIPVDAKFAEADSASLAWWKKTFREVHKGQPGK